LGNARCPGGEGGRGIGYIGSAAESFDLIVADVHMPEMDGYAFLECVRHGLSGATFRSGSLPEARRVIRRGAMGIDSYLIKPVRPSELRRLLGDLLLSTRPLSNPLPKALSSLDAPGALQRTMQSMR
jgi:CheY-like chemotaxis protein